MPAKKPFICFVSFEFFNFPNPTCNAVYPLFSFVITSKTLPFSTFTTVTGIDCPLFINSLVIPNFFPTNPSVIIKSLFLCLHLRLNLISLKLRLFEVSVLLCLLNAYAFLTQIALCFFCQYVVI